MFCTCILTSSHKAVRKKKAVAKCCHTFVKIAVNVNVSNIEIPFQDVCLSEMVYCVLSHIRCVNMVLLCDMFHDCIA